MTRSLYLYVFIPAFLLVFSGIAQADYLTRDNGQVVTIPENSNAAPFHIQLNPFGVTEDGSFPAKQLIDGFVEQTIEATVRECFESDSEPRPSVCDIIQENYEVAPKDCGEPGELVVGPTLPCPE